MASELAAWNAERDRTIAADVKRLQGLSRTALRRRKDGSANTGKGGGDA